jgi:TNF receptor-associated protein 1
VDKEKKTLTVVDNGIGMSKDDLVSNLGTIARSGSKEFVNSLSGAPNADEVASANADKHGIIGQFGVGFYAAFMVSDEVKVESIPSLTSAAAHPHKWFSDGSGEFFVEEMEPADVPAEFKHGTRVVMSIKDTCLEFLDLKKVRDIITRYSNFVAFPIKLNGEPVNTVSALWTEDKSKVTTEQYKDFYKFIANAYDEPKYTLHFRTDAPIDLKALLFVPSFHAEKFGQVRLRVSLCRLCDLIVVYVRAVWSRV